MIACGAASALDEVAIQGFDGSAERLCKLRGCTSVRHEVPAYCEYEQNHSNKRPKHFRTPCARSASLRSLALALANPVLFVRY